MGRLWKELLTKETITRGWHLARLDAKQDFSEDLYSTDVYGLDLKHHVQEAINRIRTNTYQPRPLFRMEVPKGPLTFRPGAVVPIQDRVVLSAIVLLMAEDLDKKLPDSVYSWRLKKPVPKKGPIFRETDITDLPFLKKVTIREQVDPFEGWYRLWPAFDKRTRRIFEVEEYRFLATSDIAAYFENIQLPILRDLLLKHLPHETGLVNLICSFMESWSEKTGDGRAHFRGIPQGNFISSFLGNFFLLPLDYEFGQLAKRADIRYFRYMDDVRIFTTTREDARLAIFLMARTLRKLHLNVQTAKTRIYDEELGEVSRLLIDERVDELSSVIDAIQDEWRGKVIPTATKKSYLATLNKIAKVDVDAAQKISGARVPLEGLSLRAFNRWMTAHSLVESDVYIARLLSEIAKSADAKLTRKLVAAARRFPRKRSIETSVLELISSQAIIFSHQEAECLRALRYLSTIRKETITHCWKRLQDENADRYLRMEAAYLLSRTKLDIRDLNKLQEKFESQADVYVQVAMSMLLMQRRDDNQAIIRSLVFHPNEKIRDVGKLFRTVKNDKAYAKESLRHALRPEIPWIICDHMPFIHIMAQSRDKAIRQILVDAIREPRLNHPIADVRNILKDIFTRTRQTLVE